MNERKSRWTLIPTGVLDADDLNRTEKLVYAMLCSYADTGPGVAAATCYPSQGTLARALRMKRESVNRSITTLEAKGYVEKQGRTGPRGKRTVFYYLPHLWTAMEAGRLRKDWDRPISARFRAMSKRTGMV